MIAVLVLPGRNAGMFGLDEHLPVSLLPLGDRPFLQHIIEYLVLQGVKSIEFIVEHLPERVEEYFGDGTRWGATFRYHLAAQAEFPYRSLRVVTPPAAEPWVLAHADVFACAALRPRETSALPVLFTLPEARRWSGLALFPDWSFAESIAQLTREQLTESLVTSTSRGEAVAVEEPRWISVETPATLLDSQAKLLAHELPDLMMSGIESDPGVWISRNVVIHPSARIVAPVYLGPNCRLGEGVQVGPHTVISGNCVLDEHTTAVRSLVMAGSYVGQRLELDQAIVHRQLLINARLGTGITVSENFLLGGITQPVASDPLGRITDLLLALLLIVVLSPVWLAGVVFLLFSNARLRTAKTVRTPAAGDPSTWQYSSVLYVDSVPWGAHATGAALFFARFLPGLWSVLRGELSFVGLPPRTVTQLEQLDPDWRTLALAQRAGLVTEAAVILEPSSEETEAYLADAVYAATKSWRHNLGLALSYVARCFGGGGSAVTSEQNAA